MCIIFRSFNNWTKSMLINEYMDKIRRAEGFRGQVSVLDLGCGKGGDLTKWHKAKVDHVVGVDIAATSIEQCKDRLIVILFLNKKQIPTQVS